MAWSTPYDFAAGEIVTEAIMDTYVSDNISYLNQRPNAQYVVTGANYTTTSTTFTDIDGTNVALTITGNGGDIMVVLNGAVAHDLNNGTGFFDITIDSSAYIGNSGVTIVDPVRTPIDLVWNITGLAAGAHTFVARWKQGGGTLSLIGSGMTRFWAKER